MTTPIRRRLILSLCDWSGVWFQPYVDAGYSVVRIDLKHPIGETRVTDRLTHIGCDITQFDFPWRPWGILAAPCCATFCRPGARWWNRHAEDGTQARGVSLFRECLRLAQKAEGWWALENPPGRHFRLMADIPRPSWGFHPWEYGDQWDKQTYIWGTAAKPAPFALRDVPKTHRTPNGHTQGRIAMMSSSAKTAREATPEGFARAFFEANP